jgi:hypothetical protein
MKKIFLICSIALASIVQIAQAQCSDKTIKRLCKDGLGTYIFESAAFKPLTAFGAKKNVVEAAFSVYSQESYRVLNLCQGFSDVIEFSIYDTEHNLLFSNKTDKTVKSYDFVAQKSGDFTIEFRIPPADMKSTSCCVAFAIGYK